MNNNLNRTKTEIYDKCGFHLSAYTSESEGKEYDACHFELNGLNIISRSAKITPKKVGQFVTFWKRNSSGITEPFNETDPIDFYIINVKTDDLFGQFVFPKQVLIQYGIISSLKKEGKRGFRVYPIWDKTTNKQAEKTQLWQLNYFFEINQNTNLNKVIQLYKG